MSFRPSTSINFVFRIFFSDFVLRDTQWSLVRINHVGKEFFKQKLTKRSRLFRCIKIQKAELPNTCERAIPGCTYFFLVLPEQGLLFFLWFFILQSVKMKKKTNGLEIGFSYIIFPSVLDFWASCRPLCQLIVT